MAARMPARLAWVQRSEPVQSISVLALPVLALEPNPPLEMLSQMMAVYTTLEQDSLSLVRYTKRSLARDSNRSWGLCTRPAPSWSTERGCSED